MRTDYRTQLKPPTAQTAAGLPRLLLHACCGPCSSGALEHLSGHFDVSAFFYNPNIRPREEYKKRLLSMRRLTESLPYKVSLIEDNRGGREFDRVTAGLEAEKEGGKRCEACFLLRLEKTARFAKERGFEYFCTAMTVSPRKNAETINATGSKLSEKYGLYRQDYCGCLYSRR